MAELPDTEWVRDRHALATLHDEASRPVVAPTPPWIMSDDDAPEPAAIGTIGRDNAAVLKNLLGLSDDEIAGLYERHVLQQWTADE